MIRPSADVGVRLLEGADIWAATFEQDENKELFSIKEGEFTVL